MAVIPSTSVDLATDVQKVLNNAGGSCTNDVTTFFTKENLDPYSKYKPVRSSVLFDMTDSLFEEVNYGYSIPPFTDTTTLMNAYDGITTPSSWEKPDDNCLELSHGWWYMVPNGGQTEPLRLGDFRGYNSNPPKSLFGLLDAPSRVTQKTESMRITLNAGTFGLSDFSELNGTHLGVILSDGSNIRKFKSILSSDSTSTLYNIDFDATEIGYIFGQNYGTTVKVYAFATAEESQNINSKGSYYSSKITDARPLPVAVTQIKYEYEPTMPSLSTITWTVTITSITERNITFNIKAKNSASSSVTIVIANMKYSVSAWNDDGTWDQESLNTLGSGSVTVPATSTTNVGTFTVAYAAYRELIAPWYAEVALYYPNTDGDDSWVASTQSYYE